MRIIVNEQCPMSFLTLLLEREPAIVSNIHTTDSPSYPVEVGLDHGADQRKKGQNIQQLK